jgi:ornithine cyclodeaminase
MSLLIIGEAEVHDLLPMDECIDVMGQAMRAFSAGDVGVPARTIAPLEGGEDFFILMPGEAREPAMYGAKIVSLHPGNPPRGRPAVQGFVAVFDRSTGAPAALVDGAAVTAIRTAAASALATRALAREGASSHGIFGAGVQAACHLRAISLVRPVDRVLVWGRDHGKAQEFAAEHATVGGPEVTAVEDPRIAAACDVLSVATNSPEPVLMGDWLRPGAHINLVGAHEAEHREADTEAVAKSTIYVDSLNGALAEAGDILIPMSAGAIGREAIAGEIGEVLLGSAPGRKNERQITLYKSLGTVAQDLFATAHVLGKARASGKGQLVDFP